MDLTNTQNFIEIYSGVKKKKIKKSLTNSLVVLGKFCFFLL